MLYVSPGDDCWPMYGMAGKWMFYGNEYTIRVSFAILQGIVSSSIKEIKQRWTTRLFGVIPTWWRWSLGMDK